MKTLSTIKFDPNNNDYIIGGQDFLTHLQKHESVDPQLYIPAIYSQTLVCESLLGKSDPDLEEDHVAIFLCRHCGRYDGNPIGAKITINRDIVTWNDIGYFSDVIEGCNIAFEKVREYRFDKEEYYKFIEQ